MPLEITVGPPQIVIHDGPTVWATEADGQVLADTQKGLLFADTRLISSWRIYANGQPWQLLNGAALRHFAARVFLTNPPILTQDGEIPQHTLGLVIGRWIEGGVHEDLDVTNHGRKRVRFNLEIAIRCDFADVFEIKSSRFVRRGRITTEWRADDQLLRTSYVNDDFHRSVAVRVRADCPAVYANGRITLELTLDPAQSWRGVLLYELASDLHTYPAPEARLDDCGDSRPARDLRAWREDALKLQTVNEEFYRLYYQATDDIIALRLSVEEGGSRHIVPAAGLPWFVALFGRDSLIVSLQTAPVTIEFARGALEVLGARQARDRDDWRDAEPGKILHEMRHGELAHFKLIPHTPYYGTADATPLYLMVLHAAWRWTGDRRLLEQHLETAEGCLYWIDNFGDRDGDGLQEYETRSSAGYENLGWKDSGDGVLYPDGSLVKGPKALCELQGYVYAAWTGMAEIFTALGRAERAAELRAKAKALADRFDAAFWDEEGGYYAFALDGDKNKVLSVASNPAHCLWTGLVKPERAARTVARLMRDDMFGGWGIRTLSAKHVAFNPYSYHNGSVWPHDNGIAALGMKRYGFADEASRVARAVSGAGGFFALHQLPELYAGIAREAGNFPVQYLGVNVPQAWAAGSVFAFVRAILGIEPDAPNRTLHLNPILPTWLPDLHLTDLQLGDQSFDLRFRRTESGTITEVMRGDPSAVKLRASQRPATLTP